MRHPSRPARGRSSSPMAAWPAWRVAGVGLALYGLLSGSMWLVSGLVPELGLPARVIASVLVLLLGLSFTLWSWRDFTWLSRMANGLLITLVLLAIGTLFWPMLLSGVWLWVIPLLFLALLLLAWVLPVISSSLSGQLWREQMAPHTWFGQRAMKAGLGLGLGGAGVLGSIAGTSLVRAGKAPIAYLLVALGTSILSVLIAQGFAHQLWPDTPWGARNARSTMDKKA